MVGARNLAESDHTALCLKLQVVRGLKKGVCLHTFWQLASGVETDSRTRNLGLNQYFSAITDQEHLLGDFT